MTPSHGRPRRDLLLGVPATFAPMFLMARSTAGQSPAHAAFAARARALAMRELAQASGDQPYGAVIVRGDRVIAEAPSRVVLDGDPTAHAEMEAIRRAARQLGTRDLAGCVMYSSSRPCPMCEAAAYWAGISRMYFGEAPADAGSPKLR